MKNVTILFGKLAITSQRFNSTFRTSKACIDKWTDIRQKCPMCNVELTSLSSKKDAKSQDSDHADERIPIPLALII